MTVLGDRYGPPQLFLFLIERAIQYSGRGVDIALDVTSLGRHVGKRIRDQATGRSAMEVENVFERFCQDDRQDDRAQRAFSEGSGPGAPLAKSSVEAHMSESSMTNAPGRSTTVTLDLTAVPMIRPAT